jgi:hypothetical protein
VQGTQQRLGETEVRKRNITHFDYCPYRRSNGLAACGMLTGAAVAALASRRLSRDEAPS